MTEIKPPEEKSLLDTLFTVKEAAKELLVSKSYLYKLVEKRQITHKKIGRRVFFCLSDLNDFLQKCEIKRKDSGPVLDN